MVQINKVNRRPTTAEQWNQAFSGGADFIENQAQMNQQRQQQLQSKGYMNQLGQSISVPNLGEYPENIQKEILSQTFKEKGELSKLHAKGKLLENVLNKGKTNESLSSIGKNQNEIEPRIETEFNLSNVSDEDIFMLEQQGIKGLREAKNAQIKKIEKSEQAKQTKFQADREYHSKVSRPIVDAAQSIVREAPTKQGLIDQQRRDIESGNTEGIIPFLIETTGLEVYRNPESSRFKTANKQRFIENLHQLGGSQARPNQFIEQQLASAQPTLGRNKESNLTTLELEQFIEDMKLKRAQTELELAEQDREKYGYAREDIGERANKLMSEYAKTRQDEMAYDIRKIKENNLSDQQLTNELISGSITPGTPLTARMANILMIKNNDDEKKAQAEAKRLGFIIPLESTYMR